MIDRAITQQIEKYLDDKRKIIIIYGPRQVGKTTLVNAILDKSKINKTVRINADDIRYAELLSTRDLDQLRGLVGDADLLFIDEAQRVPDIGINLKLLYDGMPQLKIIVTGSSSFELANSIQEPLTGRTRTFNLFPIAIEELTNRFTPFELKNQLESFLLYGMYPEVVTSTGVENKKTILRELTTAYLYKDILQLSNIRHADKINKLLQLIAFQVGSPVSINELSNTLQLNHETVSNYIDLLEKGFVLFRLTGFSRNLRKEVTKMDKIYFYDLGIRNMLINNFNPLDIRNDKGALWENFLVLERRKKITYENQFVNSYYWRTYTGAELDYVEEKDGKLYGYEFKYKSKKKGPPKSWLSTYEESEFQQIDQSNFLDFIS